MACAALAVVVMSFTATPAYADVLRPVAAATRRARAVHLVLRGLFRDGEDFSYVDLDAAPTEMTMWLEAPAQPQHPGRWRIDKPDRVFNFDGRETIYYLRRGNQATRKRGESIDHTALSPADWVDDVLTSPEQNVEVVVLDDRGAIGRIVLRLAAEPVTGREPAFFDEFEREIELRWDRDTNELVGMERRVLARGRWQIAAELVSVEYVESFDDAVFDLELPDDVRWVELREASAELDALPPAQAAERFFNAAIEGDWNTVEIFCPLPVVVDALRASPPTALLSLGKPFQTGGYPGWYVPYRVRYGRGAESQVRAHNLAMRNDNAQTRYICDGGI